MSACEDVSGVYEHRMVTLVQRTLAVYRGNTGLWFSMDNSGFAMQLAPADEADLGTQECAEVQQGTVQQETITFYLPEAIDGLRCVKKYAVGELCWEQVVPMGDFDAGEHVFEFEESAIPRGTLTLGQYRMKTVRPCSRLCRVTWLLCVVHVHMAY